MSDLSGVLSSSSRSADRAAQLRRHRELIQHRQTMADRSWQSEMVRRQLDDERSKQAAAHQFDRQSQQNAQTHEYQMMQLQRNQELALELESSKQQQKRQQIAQDIDAIRSKKSLGEEQKKAMILELEHKQMGLSAPGPVIPPSQGPGMKWSDSEGLSGLTWPDGHPLAGKPVVNVYHRDANNKVTVLVNGYDQWLQWKKDEDRRKAEEASAVRDAETKAVSDEEKLDSAAAKVWVGIEKTADRYAEKMAAEDSKALQDKINEAEKLLVKAEEDLEDEQEAEETAQKALAEGSKGKSDTDSINALRAHTLEWGKKIRQKKREVTIQQRNLEKVREGVNQTIERNRIQYRNERLEELRNESLYKNRHPQVTRTDVQTQLPGQLPEERSGSMFAGLESISGEPLSMDQHGHYVVG